MSQIFTGFNGKQADPGMAGSLLYHMAMVTKMESETHVLLDELHVELARRFPKLGEIYSDFQSDAKELTREITPFTLTAQQIASTAILKPLKKLASSQT